MRQISFQKVDGPRVRPWGARYPPPPTPVLPGRLDTERRLQKKVGASVGMDLNQMLIFARVVREQSFTAAARALGLPKSTVSKRVAELERRLGVRLLQRTTRKLKATEAGLAYYERCARLVADAEEAERAMAQLQSGPRGRLRVTSPTLFGHAFLQPVISEYLSAYPQASVDLMLADRRVDLVEEGFDLAIRVGVPPDSSLVTRKLGVVQQRCCASPDYVRRRGRPASPADLRDHECLFFQRGALEASWSFERGGERVEVPVRGRYSVNSFALVRQAALAGMGVASVPEFVCAEDVEQGRLVPLLEEWTTGRAEIVVLYPSARQLPARVRAFIDLLVARLAKAPPWAAGLGR